MKTSMERNMRTLCFRHYMGPSANGLSDTKLRKLAGWKTFNAGWGYCLESQKPIKPEPLSKRTISG